MSDNKALDNRYADRFFAFINNTTENECQDDLLRHLVTALHQQGVLQKDISLIDFGCGPGEMTAAFQHALRQTVSPSLDTYGFELNATHAKAAKENHGINVMDEDIFKDGMDVKNRLRNKESQRLFYVSHSGYYGFEGWTPDGSYKRSNITHQPRLEALVDNIRQAMAPDSIAFIQHKSVENTNYLKRPHGAVVESDTNLALINIGRRQGMTVLPLQIHAKLDFHDLGFKGAVPEGLWEELQNPPDYPASAFGADGKKFRDVLEFLAHRGLEEMDDKERAQYLQKGRTLIEKKFGKRADGGPRDGIDTYIQMNVVLSPDAPANFIENVKLAVESAKKSCSHIVPSAFPVQGTAQETARMSM